MGTTLLAAVGQALVAYSAARDEADELFDYHMQQMALTLRTSAPAVEQSTDTEEPEDDEGYDFVVHVWSDQGEKLFQSSRTQLPRSPERRLFRSRGFRLDLSFILNAHGH